MRLLVLGGGPAGMHAALHAREFGAEVTLVEAGQVGGTSLNHGPAPVRTLARAARLMRDAKSWERLGVRGDSPRIDIAAALASARRVADYIHDENRLGEALRRRGIDLVDGVGPAAFVDPHTVRVSDGREFRGDAVVIAVGGHAGRLPIPGVELALTYENLRDLDALPAAAVVVGGADTGCQLASILSDFGVEITLIEAGPRLVPHADQDVSDAFVGALRDRGIVVATSTRADRLERTARGIAAHYRSTAQHAQLEVDAVFLAVGWPGNADLVQAANAGIETHRGYITVDDTLRTNLAHVFAAGDVNGISMLVPSARLEGRLAAENAVLGTRRQFTHEVVPTASFTYPEYGGVGLTEAQARERYDCEVGIARYEDLVRPNIDDFPEGFCKLIVERHRRYVLGAHVLGAYSAEVIQTASACMAANLRIEQVAELRPAFPTFTEGIMVAAQSVVRQLGIAPTAPTWGDLRAVEPAPDATVAQPLSQSVRARA
ncbi:MAG TPA: NAD(P)/FAD-dependent oxidoreductase [Acidimicrobiia bacterium]|nr:NAD(P)/FAD-dependent oxidoreductase [Acidimicrobiia bacterium]